MLPHGRPKLVITPVIVGGASLATGIIWLLLGLTGTVCYVAKIITRPVVLGITLGFGCMIEGAEMMMFLLPLVGAGHGICSDPMLLGALRDALRAASVTRDLNLNRPHEPSIPVEK